MKMEFEKEKVIEQLFIMTTWNMTGSREDEVIYEKNAQRSIEVRKKGNQLFTSKNHNEELHEQVWKCYTESIALALTGSEELAVGYSNRSAFLLHLKKYKECLVDVDRALIITQSSALKVKLFCRQTECFTAMQVGNSVNSLDKAKFWLNKVDDASENKKLSEMIKKAEKVMKSNVHRNLEKEKEFEITCDNNAVDIRYNEKYGRHLIAKRDIQPGELVCEEKFYVTSINKLKLYAYCSHCLKLSWTLIPCDKCAYFMFCSKECKNEAWNKYHDIECKVKLVGLPNSTIVLHFMQLALRSLIMGIREFGGISQLRNLVQELEQCKDARTKGFSKNGTFSSNSFRSLIALSHASRCIKSKWIEMFATFTAGLLIKLAKNTTVFGRDLCYSSDSQLLHNKDVIFVGSLLVRLMLISSINAFGIFDGLKDSCKFSKNKIECIKDACCIKGANISLFTSLINHSCDSNVEKLQINGGGVVHYALKPIEKGSQIFTSYYSTDYMTTMGRNFLLHQLFEFTCDCIACTEDWPLYMTIRQNEVWQSDKPKHERLFRKLLEKSSKIEYCIVKEKGTCSKKTIRAFVKTYLEIVNTVKTQIPLSVASRFRGDLSLMMKERYDGENLKIPDKC